VRQLLGEKAFNSWRALPRDFLPEFDRRLLGLWQRNPRGSVDALGGPRFRALAKLVGPALAGRWLRWLQGRRYQDCRTLADLAELEQMMATLPAPRATTATGPDE